MPDQRRPMPPRTIIALIMGALVVWAIYVAVGAYMYNFSVARAAIVLLCMGAFLGFWLLMLWTQGPPASRD